MPNKNPEAIRKKLYEEYEDSLFKLLMHDTAEIEGKHFLEEREKLNHDPEFLPSSEAFEQFSRELDTRLKKSKTYAKRRHIPKVLNKAAVAMFFMIVILFTAVTSVQAWRVKVLNLLINIQQEYTSFQLKESKSGSGGGSPVVDWSKAYVPTYIPEGYKVSRISNNESLRKITFENEQGLFILYTELSEGNTLGVDTENASVVKTVSINGHEGTLVVKNSLVTIVWKIDNRMFTVQAPTSEDTAVKIAEGVKYFN